MKITVLGGCGTVGRVAAKTLVELDMGYEVIVADIDEEKAKEVASDLGKENVFAIKVNATDPKSIKKAIKGSDVVLNCTGPFYKFVYKVLETVIEAGINYVDVCDDVDVTEDILKMDKKARKADITAVIGMGSSPGVTNLMAKFAADRLLDEVEAVDIYHAHGGEPTEGAGVIGHRFHCMGMDIPMFLNGKMETVRFFEEDGIALQEEVEFYRLGENIRVYPYPHPEQVTIPKFIKLNRVTNKGAVLPEEYYNLTKELFRLGLTDTEPLQVGEQEVAPYDFAIAFLLKERERILKETKFGDQRGCVKVVVTGEKDGKWRRYIFQIASESQALGEGTGMPAAMGVVLMTQGKITEKGVLPPEGCINPVDFLSLVQLVMKPEEGGKSFDKVLVEMVDENGLKQKVDI